ncbi:hypothetical protein RJ639_039625 [Escallonia herrerae]|uniref:Proton pump-interactor 1 n=1 Tax=Escallonia herrerae TaxID=1293975 RepID=A0AA88WWJ9_9ASTE|nr:hypothetical protein RJ639_039625 [Escallonia herrerae]
MVLEAVESELAHVPVEAGNEENNSMLHEKENGDMNGLNEPIKFGTHGADEPVNGETNIAAVNNLPKDAVDEWPAPKQYHYFYIMKYRSYDDQKLKVKLEQADNELRKLNQARFQVTEKLKAKRADRAQVIDQLRSLTAENKQFRMMMDEKRKEMEPLQQALGKLRGGNNRERGFGICSSEEELNYLIKSLQYRIQHESIPLTEEKQILREIKQLEGTRDKVIANAAVRAKIQDSLGEKETIQDQVKLIGGDLDGVRKDQQVVKAKIKQLDDEKEGIEKEINVFQEELAAVIEKRDKAFEKIQELRKQREEGNACFYQNRSLLLKARELAAKKDVEALKELSDTEVDKFVSLWTSTKAVRDDYEKRILSSLDMRLLSKDARMRNPGEKPLVTVEAPTPSEVEIVSKSDVKPPKEDKAALQIHTASVQKVQKENKSKPQKDTKSKVTDIEDREGITGLEKLEKDPPTKRNEVDEAKLKEMKREEEMAKAKLALERKKKLAEKAATKAAEREKKAKKKAGASVSAPDPEETSEEVATSEVAEQEKAEGNVEAPVPPKTKERKENKFRHRTRPRGQDSLPRTMLKRKKPTNYWVWAAPAALFVVMLLVIGYYYLL